MADEKSMSYRLLSSILYISQKTANFFQRLCCCCLNPDSPQPFLWALFKQNAFTTIGYFLLFLVFGMCVGLMGPTLEDLACYTEQQVNTVSWLFFAQTCCMVLGVFVGGLISKWVSPDFMLLIAVACLPLTLLVVSFSRRIELLAPMMAVMGLAMGIIDCLTNLQLINIYDKAVAPFLQALHFCYGIGALLSPLLAHNFILGEDCSILVRNVTLAESDPHHTHLNLTEDALHYASHKTRVYQAFWIVAAIQVPVLLYMALLVIKNGCRIKAVNPEFKRLINSESKPILEELKGKEKSKAEKYNLLRQWQKYINEFQGSHSISFSKALVITIAACLMVFIYDGLQGHANEFTEMYAVKIIEDKNKHDQILYLNVSFWAAYSLGRLISVCLAIKFTPYFMLLLSISLEDVRMVRPNELRARAMFYAPGDTGLVLSVTHCYGQNNHTTKLYTVFLSAYVFVRNGIQNFALGLEQIYAAAVFRALTNNISDAGCETAAFMFLSCMGGQHFSILMAANVVLGLSMSSITPTTITMTEHFMDMTNLQMSLIIGGAALGEMLIPITEGQLIDEHPATFVTMLVVLVGLSWLVYAVFWLMGRVTQKFKAMASPSFIWYNPQRINNIDSPSSEGLALAAKNYSNGADQATRRDSRIEDTALNERGIDEQIETQNHIDEGK